MTKERWFYYRVWFSDRPYNWGGVLDMLRYDGAIVMDWRHLRDTDQYQLALRSTHPTPDRWKSFGIGIGDLRDMPVSLRDPQ